MPRVSDRQKLLEALHEAQQALGLQIYLQILQAAIEEASKDSSSGSPAGEVLHSNGYCGSLILNLNF